MEVYFFGKKKYFPHQKKAMLTTVFEYHNNTPNTQMIDDVRTSCGCIKVEYSPRPIKPGARGGVGVCVDLKESDVFNKTIAVYFHGQKPVILKIIGRMDTNVHHDT